MGASAICFKPQQSINKQTKQTAQKNTYKLHTINLPSQKKKHNQRIEKETQKPLSQQAYLSVKKYGITITEQKNLQFSHAPLYANQYLLKKFKENQRRPSQINIPCMVSQIEINLQKGVIKANIINQNPVQLWVVCSGTQKLSITGLTISIQDIFWCGNMKIKSQSPEQGKWHRAKPKKDISKCQKITFILCQVSQQNSLFIYNQYRTLDSGLVRQKIEWNSLSFNLRDIYRNSLIPQNQKGVKQNIVTQEFLCVRCKQKQIQCIFLPCRHMSLCTSCTQAIKSSNKCYTCQKKYKRIIIYRSGVSLAQNQERKQEDDQNQMKGEQDIMAI